MSTHTRPSLVTCVGLGQKKGQDGWTHIGTHIKNKNNSFLTPNVKCGKGAWNKSIFKLARNFLETTKRGFVGILKSTSQQRTV